MEQPKDQKKKKPDPYRTIKYLGYRLSQLPDKYVLSDLVRYAKFQLSRRSGRLIKDPIWDEYTVEELLVEFFAHQFEDNDKFKLSFEQEINASSGAIDDFNDWADREMNKEAKIRDGVMGELEDRVVFDPKDVMGDD